MIELTKEEKLFVARLKRLERDWPDRFVLQSGGSGNSVSIFIEEAQNPDPRECEIDPRGIVAHLRIPADGGDPDWREWNREFDSHEDEF